MHLANSVILLYGKYYCKSKSPRVDRAPLQLLTTIWDNIFYYMYVTSVFDRAIVILLTTISYNTWCYKYDKTHFNRAIVPSNTIYNNIISYAYIQYINALNQYLHIYKINTLDICIHILSTMQILISEMNFKAVPSHTREFYSMFRAYLWL